MKTVTYDPVKYKLVPIDTQCLPPRKQTPLERYTEIMDEVDATEKEDSVENLRFYLSMALHSDDWLDVEQFFDEVLKERDTLQQRLERQQRLLESVLHSVEQALVPGNDWRRELNLIRNSLVDQYRSTAQRLTNPED